MSVDVGPCELFHFLLSDLVKHLQKEKQFQTGEFLWLNAVYPGSLSDRNVGVFLSVHLVAQSSI